MASILVIDDDSMFRRLVCKLIGNAGHQSSEAEDGHAGLAAARAQRPDLIVTDMSMPGLTGFELIRELRKDPATATVPIAVVSAHETAEDHDEAFTAGCDAYIEKTLAPEKLIAQILSALR